MEPVSVGIVGCGSISEAYFEAGERFEAFEVRACADLDETRAEEKADAYDAQVLSTEDLFADPGIEVAIILTPPSSHRDLAIEALEAGTHVYTEKPLAASRDGGREILAAAAENGRLVGAAPDTFMGTGIQTCRDAIEGGEIGDPIGATAIWATHGHEHWHPDPEGFYGAGGGPLFDMGPYYVTALVNLLGPAEAVSGAVRRGFETRRIESDPRRGEEIDVDVPTHETGVIEFENGATATILTSFDVWGTELSGFEVYGSDGTLSVTDPNGFDGVPRIHGPEAFGGAFESIDVTREHPGQARGFGVVDLSRAIRTDWEQRASGDLAVHVLDVLDGLREASESGKRVELGDGHRPAPIPDGFPEER